MPRNGADGVGKIAAVLDVVLDRFRPEEAARPGVLEDLDQEGVLVHLGAPSESAGSGTLAVGRCRDEHDAASRLLTLGLGRHTVDLGRGVMHDLAIERRHRLERLGATRLEHLLGDAPRELLEGLSALRRGSRRRRR